MMSNIVQPKYCVVRLEYKKPIVIIYQANTADISFDTFQRVCYLFLQTKYCKFLKKIFSNNFSDFSGNHLLNNFVKKTNTIIKPLLLDTF